MRPIPGRYHHSNIIETVNYVSVDEYESGKDALVSELQDLEAEEVSGTVARRHDKYYEISIEYVRE
jgi:hypothetical protein